MAESGAIRMLSGEAVKVARGSARVAREADRIARAVRTTRIPRGLLEMLFKI